MRFQSYLKATVAAVALVATPALAQTYPAQTYPAQTYPTQTYQAPTQTVTVTPQAPGMSTPNVGPRTPTQVTPFPELSPLTISADSRTEYIEGRRVVSAPTFNPFEDSSEFAGTAALRSSDGGFDRATGAPLPAGAVLDLSVIYTGASDDPYDVRGFQDAVFLSGEPVPSVRYDSRNLECSSRVTDVVYRDDYYSGVSHGLIAGLYMAYPRYRNYRGFRSRFGHGGFYGGGHRGYRGGFGGHYHGPHYRRDGRHRRGALARRLQDQARRDGRLRREDRSDYRQRDSRHRDIRQREDTQTRRDRRRDRGFPRDGGTYTTDVPRGSAVLGDPRLAQGNRLTEGSRRRTPLTSGRRGNDRNGRNGRNGGGRTTVPTVANPAPPLMRGRDRDAVMGTVGGRRAEPRRAEPRRAEPRRAEPRRAEPRRSEPKRSNPKRSSPKRSPRSVDRATDRAFKRASPKRSSPKRSGPKTRRVDNYYPRNTRVDSYVDARCAKEESLTLFIPTDRLDAARFDGLTVVLLGRDGSEIPVWVPPNYIEGFRLASGT